LRVPVADCNCLKLPPGEEHEDECAMLADIFPTGYQATELAGVSPGDTVAVYGGGPVGLMAAYSSILRGASRVFVVDKVPDRLRVAQEIGATQIDFTKGSAPAQNVDLTDSGVDRGIDAVGYPATVPESEERPAPVLNDPFESVRPSGSLCVVGLYVPTDPGRPTEED